VTGGMTFAVVAGVAMLYLYRDTDFMTFDSRLVGPHV
jgi:hypothetical protein